MNSITSLSKHFVRSLGDVLDTGESFISYLFERADPILHSRHLRGLDLVDQRKMELDKTTPSLENSGLLEYNVDTSNFLDQEEWSLFAGLFRETWSLYRNFIRTVSTEEHDLTELSTDVRLQMNIFARKLDYLRCKFDRHDLLSPLPVQKNNLSFISGRDQFSVVQRNNRDKRFENAMHMLPTEWSELASLCFIHGTFDASVTCSPEAVQRSTPKNSVLDFANRYLIKYGNWKLNCMNGSVGEGLTYARRHWSYMDHLKVFNWFCKTTADQEDWLRMYERLEVLVQLHGSSVKSLSLLLGLMHQFLNNMTPENAAHLGESYRLCTVTLLSKSANWDENSWLEDGLLPPRLLIRCWLVAHARTDLGSVRTFFSKLFITWLNADNYSYTECRTALSGTVEEDNFFSGIYQLLQENIDLLLVIAITLLIRTEFTECKQDLTSGTADQSCSCSVIQTALHIQPSQNVEAFFVNFLARMHSNCSTVDLVRQCLLELFRTIRYGFAELCALWPERPLDYEDVLQQLNDFDTENNDETGISSNRTIIDLVKNLSASDTSIDGNRSWCFNICSRCSKPATSARASLILPKRLAQLVASRYVSGEKGLRFLIDHCPQLLDDLSAQTVVHLWKPKDPWRKSSERKPDPVSKISSFLLNELHTHCQIEQQPISRASELLEQLDEQFMQLLLSSPKQVMDKHWGFVITNNGLNCELCALNAGFRISKSGLDGLPSHGLLVGAVSTNQCVMICPCKHVFHTTCIEQIGRNSLECPVCVDQN